MFSSYDSYFNDNLNMHFSFPGNFLANAVYHRVVAYVFHRELAGRSLFALDIGKPIEISIQAEIHL